MTRIEFYDPFWTEVSRRRWVDTRDSDWCTEGPVPEGIPTLLFDLNYSRLEEDCRVQNIWSLTFSCEGSFNYVYDSEPLQK